MLTAQEQGVGRFGAPARHRSLTFDSRATTRPAPEDDPHTRRRRATRRPATAEEARIDAVWRVYRANPTVEGRHTLVEYYMRHHVQRIAERLQATLPRHIDLDDLVQQGYLGLVESIQRFEIDRGIRFETFSSRRISGSMRDYLREQDTVPRLTRARSRRVQRAVEDYRKVNGREPDTDELREVLDVDERQFKQFVADRDPAATIPFSVIVGPDENDENDAVEGVTDERRSQIIAELERCDTRRWLCRDLNHRDRLLIVLYYYENMTMKEVGATLGCSESRVSQCLDSVLQRLRSRLDWVRDGAEFSVR